MSDSTPVAATDHQDQEVLITRIFDAPRERVFRAWTDPDEVAEWYGPEHFDTPRERIHIDLRVGGRYELTMVQRDNGAEFAIGYEIVELRGAGADRAALGPDAGGGHARADSHARGVPRPRHQDAHDSHRRALPAGPRPCRGRVDRSLRQARHARRGIGPFCGAPDRGIQG